jgi:trimethylamine--corrinoid protein Co-methyltransferase
MQTEYLYPEVASRLTPKEWFEVGRPELIAEARRRKETILQMAPLQVPPEVDCAVRARVSIRF